MGTVTYLDQLRPAGSLRAFAGPMITATAPPTVAYVYDATDWSCVVLHSSAYRDACSWRAVALNKAECEREALAHHAAEHLDVHNSAGRTFNRAPADEAEYLDRCLARLRRDRELFVRLTPGVALNRISAPQRPYFPDALAIIAQDATYPELQAWARGFKRKPLSRPTRAENPEPAQVERLVAWVRARREKFLVLGNVGHVRRQIGPPRRDLAVNALETLAADTSDPEFSAWAQGLVAKWEAKQAKAA